MEILIYGIGRYSDRIENSLLDSHKVIGYTDSFSKINLYKGKPFFRVEEISRIKFDYIVVTIYNRDMLVKICDDLENRYHVERKKIIPYFLWANSEKYHYRLRNSVEDIQGIILGNSHAFYAFQTDCFSVPFLNLACPSQDIYFDYMVLKSSIQKYSSKLQSLKYIVIDLYDYNNFNIDASMGKNLFDYFSWGGYVDEHNFSKNENYNHSFRQQAYEEKKILVDIGEHESVMKTLFESNYNCIEVCSERNCWGHINGDEPLTASVLLSTNVMEKHENTIRENKSIFISLLEEIKKFRSDVKIVFTLVPRFYSMEMALKRTIDDIWKEEFMTFIRQMCKEYNAAFFSYKENDKIFQNPQFYQDVCHLNTVGGRCVTSILNEELKNICD